MALGLFTHPKFYIFLVHSRIKRVFYALPHPKGQGGLNETLNIAGLNKINHKYFVFANTFAAYANEKLLPFLGLSLLSKPK